MQSDECLHLAAPLDSATEGHGVGVFQVAAHWESPRQARNTHSHGQDELGQIHGGCLALEVGVGGQ